MPVHLLHALLALMQEQELRWDVHAIDLRLLVCQGEVPRGARVILGRDGEHRVVVGTPFDRRDGLLVPVKLELR